MFLWRGAPELFCTVSARYHQRAAHAGAPKATAIRRGGTCLLRNACVLSMSFVGGTVFPCLLRAASLRIRSTTPYGRHYIPALGFSDSNRCAVHDLPHALVAVLVSWHMRDRYRIDLGRSRATRGRPSRVEHTRCTLPELLPRLTWTGGRRQPSAPA